jgi:hypothetical protein
MAVVGGGGPVNFGVRRSLEDLAFVNAALL